MTRLRRSAATLVGLAAASGVLAIGAATVLAKPASAGKADNGVVYFAITHAANGKQYAAGNSTDSLFGTGAVTYAISAAATPNGVKVTVKPVTIYTSTGTLTGTATAILTTAAGGTQTISGGKLTAADGTGGQKGHSITATFQGSGSTVTGTFKITYKGIYR